MAAIFELDQFDKLPLWGQVLLATRMVRRGTLAMLPDEADPMRQRIVAACDAIDKCAEHGDGVTRVRSVLDKAAALRDGRTTRLTQAIAQSVWWTIDAARAAEAANDFPIDSTVTHSALSAIRALAEDRRITPLQLSILMAADLDQIRFACGEARIGTYQGLTAHVFGRLAPVHALTLTEPTRSPEENAR